MVRWATFSINFMYKQREGGRKEEEKEKKGKSPLLLTSALKLGRGLDGIKEELERVRGGGSGEKGVEELRGRGLEVLAADVRGGALGGGRGGGGGGGA